MKHFFLFMFVMFGFGLSAQCKYVRNEFDPFLKSQVKETKATLFNGFSERFNINFIKVGDTLAAKVLFSSAGINSVVVSERQPIIFIMENDSLVTLHPSDISTGDFKEVGGMNVTMTHVLYGIDQVSAILLRERKIKAFRMYQVGGYKQHDVSQKNAEKVNISFQCVLR